MSTKADTSLRVSRVIRADPATVFAAWTEPDQLKRWSCPEGASIADAKVDLRVGGKYRIRMQGADGEVHTAVGVYREIEPPDRRSARWRARLSRFIFPDRDVFEVSGRRTHSVRMNVSSQPTTRSSGQNPGSLEA